jgi:hypothetical protein
MRSETDWTEEKLAAGRILKGSVCPLVTSTFDESGNMDFFPGGTRHYFLPLRGLSIPSGLLVIRE